MHHTKIGIFKIAQTRVNWPAVTEWLEFLGVKAPQEIHRQLFVGTDASGLVALCGKRCYNSFEVGAGNPNISKIRTDHAEYVENILKSGHGSLFEHATWSFAIENISRIFTGEMNRHRAGVAVSEGSQRFIRFDDIGFTIPDSLESDLRPFLERNVEEDLLENRKRMTRTLFKQSFSIMENIYIDLCNIWKIGEMTDFAEKKKLTSMFRRIVGMGVATGGVWTLNARALRHVLAMRGSVHAEEEIYGVFNRIAEVMIADEPLLFGDFSRDATGNWAPKYPKI